MQTANTLRTASPVILTAVLLPVVSAIAAGGFDLANNKSVQTKEPAKKILRAEDFSDDRLQRGSGLEDVQFVVEISPRLTPYVFHLIPNSATQWSREPRNIGRIEISRLGDSDLLQTIDVTVVADVSWFTKTFCAKDINFDGYLDFMILSDQGAKWGSYDYWLFNPESGRFITNQLTLQLGKLMANTYHWRPESRTLHLSFLQLDQARISETYRIENGRLTLIEIKERLKDCDGNFQEVMSRIIDGKRDGKDTLTLEPCNRLTQNIAEGQVHNYEITLEASQSLLIGIETGNIDLVITLFGPAGEKLAVREVTFDRESAKISWVALSSGVYRTEVRPTKTRPADGLYFIWLEQPRPTHPSGSAVKARAAAADISGQRHGVW